MSNGEVKELWGRSFHLVRRGLDEAEVLTFVNELLRSDSTLVQRQKQMLSLQELSQQMATMVTEARTLSDNIVQQARMEAEAMRTKTMAEARNAAGGGGRLSPGSCRGPPNSKRGADGGLGADAPGALYAVPGPAPGPQGPGGP